MSAESAPGTAIARRPPPEAYDLGRVTNELTILEFERLSVNITSVDVEWMARNASDEVISTELFRYVLSGRDSGDYRIRCAIERTPV